MRERHLDGTVLMRQGSTNTTVFETLVRPDLLITDAERANVTTARRKDRDMALLGMLQTHRFKCRLILFVRLYHCHTDVSQLNLDALRRKHTCS